MMMEREGIGYPTALLTLLAEGFSIMRDMMDSVLFNGGFGHDKCNSDTVATSRPSRIFGFSR